jgi:hypothetical protein
MNRLFPVYCFVPIVAISLVLGGCTSDPYAPINQTTPTRQLDNAFDPSGSRYYERTAPAPYPARGYDSPSYSRY